ncbi:MarR family transcriptional regulator [Streptomyces roseoverticillatus]|uniref:MarR family transcriptional regulator n=1 Tax=Streptomyces roseoverticillatus TaxID=66429 RepID=UPI001F273460|nr:MarR family transcriptional regulator [Streptomyces roseoverticillatus]MCF3100369.1 MarR family transcriptional regulator [Streptomyces roseoverticillatus]
MKPIGYWLNRTDQALTRTMDSLLAEYGLTRIAWQVLNVVQDARGSRGPGPPVRDHDVLTVLAANADAAALTAAVEAVLAGGWAARPEPGRLALTCDGRARLAEAAERVHAFRELSAAGISPEEYRTAVSVLERMTRNLESLPAT